MAYAKRKNDDGVFTVQSKDKWILSSEVIQELAIVDEETWDKVQEIRSSRTPDKMKKEGIHRYAKYRCGVKAVGKACDGQTLYAQNKVEGLVLEEVFKYLDQLKKNKFFRKNRRSCQKSN